MRDELRPITSFLRCELLGDRQRGSVSILGSTLANVVIDVAALCEFSPTRKLSLRASLGSQAISHELKALGAFQSTAQ